MLWEIFGVLLDGINSALEALPSFPVDTINEVTGTVGELLSTLNFFVPIRVPLGIAGAYLTFIVLWFHVRVLLAVVYFIRGA